MITAYFWLVLLSSSGMYTVPEPYSTLDKCHEAGKVWEKTLELGWHSYACIPVLKAD